MDGEEPSRDSLGTFLNTVQAEELEKPLKTLAFQAATPHIHRVIDPANLVDIETETAGLIRKRDEVQISFDDAELSTFLREEARNLATAVDTALPEMTVVGHPVEKEENYCIRVMEPLLAEIELQYDVESRTVEGEVTLFGEDYHIRDGGELDYIKYQHPYFTVDTRIAAAPDQTQMRAFENAVYAGITALAAHAGDEAVAETLVDTVDEPGDTYFTVLDEYSGGELHTLLEDAHPERYQELRRHRIKS